MFLHTLKLYEERGGGKMTIIYYRYRACLYPTNEPFIYQAIIDNTSKKARLDDIENTHLTEEVEEEEVDMIPHASTRRVLTNAQLFGGYIDRYFSK
jgi:hypothetical protein